MGVIEGVVLYTFIAGCTAFGVKGKSNHFIEWVACIMLGALWPIYLGPLFIRKLINWMRTE